MLHNRVDPFGNLLTTSARGTFMGNRGVIHNDRKEITHVFRNKAWIICKLEFKGRKRAVMTPNRWTELFFLDEATALSAGHRPCFECRREEAKFFKSCWIKGNPEHGFNMATSIREIDEVIHRERVDVDKKKLVHNISSSDLADGIFLLENEVPYLFKKNQLHRWTPFEYESPVEMPQSRTLAMLTPPSVARAIQAGYKPSIHEKIVKPDKFCVIG